MSNINFKQHPLTFQGDQAAQTPLKGNRWVLRVKLWVRALKMAQIWDFWDLYCYKTPENCDLLSKSNFKQPQIPFCRSWAAKTPLER